MHGVGDLNMKSCRPIGYGEGDEEARQEWENSKDILMIKFSNDLVVFGDKNDKDYTEWVFSSEENGKIISTTLLTKEEAQIKLNK